jgi:hypothetical protein
MGYREEIVARFGGRLGGDALYLPDLTLWYSWHRRQGTLPAGWAQLSLPDVARAMEVPIWLPIRPWRVEISGVAVQNQRSANRRTLRYETPAGVLETHWILGPDGDWWQEEHLVKNADDLPAARHLAEGLTYILDPGPLEEARRSTGDDGVVALELPRRPYSDLLHDYVGWGQGLLLLMGKEQGALLEIAAILEAKLQELVNKIASLAADLALSPDNLDGQYISPRIFREHLSVSYRRTAEQLHAQGKPLVVHAGGGIRRLLPLLAGAGVDGIEGVAGPPQSDATLVEAREEAGPELVLWGGIAQDLLIDPRTEEEFRAGVRRAMQEERKIERCMLGVADRVPTTARVERLCAIPSLVRRND